jgi:spermidine synthase
MPSLLIDCVRVACAPQHLGEYFAAVNRLLKPDGVFVMEAITTPESRYVEYLKVRGRHCSPPRPTTHPPADDVSWG